MTASTAETLVTGTLTTFGSSVLVILTAVIGIGVAYLIFRFGWYKIQSSLGSYGESKREQAWLSRQPRDKERDRFHSESY